MHGVENLPQRNLVLKDEIRTSYQYYSVRRIDAEPNSMNRQRLCKRKVAALLIDSPRLVDT